MDPHLVFIPGALSTEEFWKYQVPVFSKQATLSHVDINHADSIMQMAETFAKQAPKQFIPIGFSMGGYVALELYRLIPNQIAGLILINSGARLLSEKGAKERERSVRLIQRNQFNRLVDLIFYNSVYTKTRREEIITHLQTMAKIVGAPIYLNQLNAILNKPDHTALIETIRCPTLVVASRQDQIMPTERSEHLASTIPNAELHYIEDCGHMAPLEKPEFLNRLILNFLNKVTVPV